MLQIATLALRRAYAELTQLQRRAPTNGGPPEFGAPSLETDSNFDPEAPTEKRKSNPEFNLYSI